MDAHFSADMKSITVFRTGGDPVFRGSGWGAAESRFLYHLKQLLIEREFDVIKTRMAKDGHLAANEYKQYIRTRSARSQLPHFFIYNENSADRWCAAKEFNVYDMVTLKVDLDPFGVAAKLIAQLTPMSRLLLEAARESGDYSDTQLHALHGGGETGQFPGAPNARGVVVPGDVPP